MAAERLPARIRQVDGRFEAGHQAVVAVGGRAVTPSTAGACFEQAADVTAPFRSGRHSRPPENSGLPSFHKLLVTCMPEPLSPKSGFGMNVAVLPTASRHVLDDVLVLHQISSADVTSVSKRLVDLGLAGGGDFVVAALDSMPQLDQLSTISLRRSCLSVGGDREVAFLEAGSVAQVAAFSLLAGVPVPSSEST